jgi:leucyl aminopeptidase (aminopeptidase T)
MIDTKDYYKYELIKAADVLVRDMIKLKKDETIIITLDTTSDYRVADAIAGVAYSVGGKPMVISMSTPLGIAKEADKFLPVETLTAVITKADVWVDMGNADILYSTPYTIGVNKNPNIRYLSFGGGMNVDLIVRCIGRLKYEAQKAFQVKLTERTKNAKTVRVTTPSGGKQS